MKTRYLIFIFAGIIFVSTENIFAQIRQDSITLQGTVLDSATKEPLPFAHVFLLKDGKTIAGAATDMLGKYKIRTVNDSDLSVFVCYISYFNKRIDNINTYKSTVIETIYMKENENYDPVFRRGR